MEHFLWVIYFCRKISAEKQTHETIAIMIVTIVVTMISLQNGFKWTEKLEPKRNREKKMS